jgi:hypothetical protein
MGRFYIDGHLLEALRFADVESEDFKRFLALTSQVFILEVRQVIYMDRIEYVGISALFDELEEGDRIPQYELEGLMVEDRDSEGNVTGMHYEAKAFRRMPNCLFCGAPQK